MGIGRKMFRTGALIVIEGIDGAGKSTQVARLASALRDEGFDVRTSHEPTDGPHGRRIRELSKRDHGNLSAHGQLDLFLKDRREHVRNVILPALAAGSVVLLDRYYLSTIAYQGALGIDPEVIKRKNEAFAPQPDLAVILTLPVQQALSRIRTARPGGPNALFERAEYLNRVADLFGSMRSRFEGADTAIEFVDTTADPDVVTTRILELVRARLRALDVKPLSSFRGSGSDRD
jgi:dTMP kinase